MTSDSNDQPTSDLPIEEQGLPTRSLDEIDADEAGRSMPGDEPDAGHDGSSGTRADDLDADDADAARAAAEADRDEQRADASVAHVGGDADDEATDPSHHDAPPPDREQPLQNPPSADIGPNA